MENPCKLLKQLYLEDEKAIHKMTFLDENQATEMRNHIANCSECQQRAMRIRIDGANLINMILNTHKLIKE